MSQSNKFSDIFAPTYLLNYFASNFLTLSKFDIYIFITFITHMWKCPLKTRKVSVMCCRVYILSRSTLNERSDNPQTQVTFGTGRSHNEDKQNKKLNTEN